MKVDIPSFIGNLDIKFFLDWIDEVDKFFDMAYVPEENLVKFVEYKLNGRVVAWWDQLKITKNQDKPLVMTWRRMKQLLKGRFFPTDYQQILYNQFERCK